MRPAILATAEHFEPLHHEGAIHAGERHHVANGRQGHDVEPLEQVRRLSLRIKAFGSQNPLGGDAHQKDNARGAEMALPAQAIFAVGIDDGIGRRKVFADLMMVGNHNIHALLGGNFERIEVRRAAVDRHNKLGAVFNQRGDRRLVWPIAFRDPVGNVDASIEPCQARKRRRSADDEAPSTS